MPSWQRAGTTDSIDVDALDILQEEKLDGLQVDRAVFETVPHHLKQTLLFAHGQDTVQASHECDACLSAAGGCVAEQSVTIR